MNLIPRPCEHLLEELKIVGGNKRLVTGFDDGEILMELGNICGNRNVWEGEGQMISPD